MANINLAKSSLCSCLLATPPDLTLAEEILAATPLDPDALSEIAVNYLHEAEWDDEEADGSESCNPLPAYAPNRPSTYIIEILQFLLDHGLDPNGLYNEETILHLVTCINNDLLAADALNLLLECGGDPNIFDPDVGSKLFHWLNFQVAFDSIELYNRSLYASKVHCFLVLIGHLGEKARELEYLHLFQRYADCDFADEFPVEAFKDHRNLYFGLSCHGGKKLTIFDKATLFAVAELEL